MIETLISSKIRIKLLLKSFLNSNTTAYLRSLESEYGGSTNAIRLELNRLERAGMLSACMEGNKKVYKANKEHPLFNEIHNIILKQVGIDKIIENIIKRLGDVSQVFLTGDFAKGKDSTVIDLLLVGYVNKTYLVQLIDKVEQLINRKIRYLIYEEKEFADFVNISNQNKQMLLLWQKEIEIQDERANK